MAKGMIKNPGYVKVTCQYCEKEFDYYRESSTIRKSCFECLPKGRESDASLIRRLVKLKAIRHKGNKCHCCGKQFPSAVYDFHHLDPTQKDFGLGDKTSTVKWEKVVIELEKCILVCANCHRMIHSRDLKIEEQQEMVASK